MFLEMARDTRIFMESPAYRRLFPGARIDPRKNSESEFETTARGYRLATSARRDPPRPGWTYLILDDPMQPGEAMSETQVPD